MTDGRNVVNNGFRALATVEGMGTPFAVGVSEYRGRTTMAWLGTTLPSIGATVTLEQDGVPDLSYWRVTDAHIERLSAGFASADLAPVPLEN